MKKKNRFMALCLAALLSFNGTTALVTAGEAAPEEETQIVETLEEESAEEAETPLSEEAEDLGIDLSIKREIEIRKETGLSLGEWDELIAKQRKDALLHPYTKEELEEKGSEVSEDAYVYYVGPGSALDPVTSLPEAYHLAYRLVPLMGGSEDIYLYLYAQLGNQDETIYAFQQFSQGDALLGSVMKIAVNEAGEVTAVFATLEQGEGGEGVLLTAEEAERAVTEHEKAEGREVKVLEGKSDRIITYKATYEDLDMANEETIPIALYYVVYSEAPEGERPYLAHYLTSAGEYLYSIPVMEPGDEDSLSAHVKEDIFANMVPGEWSGQLRRADGAIIDVTLPVMQNTEDSRWYLGDVEKQIAVVDYAPLVYEEDHPLVLVGQDENEGWDNEDLFLLYNYLRSYDFFQKELGWDGPDGEDTGVLLLKNLCSRDGIIIPNAGSFGKIQSWQMFGYTPYNDEGKTSPLNLTHAMDVLAHEYTHTFTSTVMCSNLYENDLGAINEAMSDIFGNLVEQRLGDTKDTLWNLGENTGSTIRSMLYPHDYSQPEKVWDLYYGEPTDIPLTSNDRGGVHRNSSILNRIAAMLCTEGGMSQSEAFSYWTMVAMGLCTRIDHVQIPAVLRWAMVNTGLESYLDELNTLIEEEALDLTEMPEMMPSNLKVKSLVLPSTPAFEDPNWMMLAYQLNADNIGTILGAGIEILYNMFTKEDAYAEFISTLDRLLDSLQIHGMDIYLSDLRLEEDPFESDTFLNILQTLPTKLITQHMGWPGAGSNEIRLVVEDSGPMVYLLLNVTEGGTKVNSASLLAGNHWMNFDPNMEMVEESSGDKLEIIQMVADLVNFFQNISDDMKKAREEKALEGTGEDDAGILAEIVYNTIHEGVSFLARTNETRTFPLEPTVIESLPNNGLEEIELTTEEEATEVAEETTEAAEETTEEKETT